MNRLRSGLQTFHRRLTLPRAWILGISALLWLIPAFVLLRFVLAWTEHLEQDVYLLSSAGTLVVTALGYFVWFKRIVLRNINRIRSLPDRSMIWQVASPASYGIMVVMIGMGLALRSSDLPRLYLAGPYALMGGCLLLGSIHTASTLFREIRHDRESA